MKNNKILLIANISCIAILISIYIIYNHRELTTEMLLFSLFLVFQFYIFSNFKRKKTILLQDLNSECEIIKNKIKVKDLENQLNDLK